MSGEPMHPAGALIHKLLKAEAGDLLGLAECQRCGCSHLSKRKMPEGPCNYDPPIPEWHTKFGAGPCPGVLKPLGYVADQSAKKTPLIVLRGGRRGPR